MNPQRLLIALRRAGCDLFITADGIEIEGRIPERLEADLVRLAPGVRRLLVHREAEPWNDYERFRSAMLAAGMSWPQVLSWLGGRADRGYFEVSSSDRQNAWKMFHESRSNRSTFGKTSINANQQPETSGTLRTMS